MSSRCPSCDSDDCKVVARVGLSIHPTVVSYECGNCKERWSEGEYTDEQRIIKQ